MVRLGFRAFDPHELLVHFIAERGGLYREVGVEVELVDLRVGHVSHDATCACGTALFQVLDGAPVEILLIASAAPLFWLYGRGTQLDGARVATYPHGAPPARFLELALGGCASFVPARDDAARLALVSEGEADCALLSSGTPPSRVPDELEELFCVADRIPIPSTGLAVPRGHAGVVELMAEAHRHALELLARDPQIGCAVVREAFGFTDDEAAWALDAVARHFTSAGRVTAAYLDNALRTVGASHSPYTAGAIDDRNGQMPLA